MLQTERPPESGYLYVLTHPSNPKLFKIGKSTRHPEVRLAEHNRNYEEYAGRIVKETGRKWELQTYLPVPDTFWAEAVFWSATGLADIPYRGGIEVEYLDPKNVEAGLEAVKRAGVKPPPPPVPDHIYAYRAWMNKRVKGRGITLLGHVRSKHGKSDFRCSNNHEWRTVPNRVAEGDGCPQCGVGEKTPEEMKQAVTTGVLCLLLHPGKPGLIRMGLTYSSLEHACEQRVWGDWQVHRFRHVDEPELAESLIWELLGYPQPNNGEPIKIELNYAEDVFRNLHYRLVSEIALLEKAKDLARLSK